ncbi:MAG: heme-binding domain-containing protein [Gaiellaceae bacterium]
MGTLLGMLALAQAVPYGRSHTNPPVTMEPSWDSPQTRAIAARSCFDCHSNLTRWGWYTNLAPVSWLIQRDVDAGRSSLNFSQWDKPQDVSTGDVSESISSGSMPPWFYTLPHPGARLSSADKRALIAGLAATFAATPPRGGGGG